MCDHGEFHRIVATGRLDDVIRFVDKNPGVDYNWRDKDGSTALHSAVLRGHGDGVLSLLLAQPGIEVNLENRAFWTPFSLASASPNIEAAKVLLRDPRVEPNSHTNSSVTPLCHATMGWPEMIRWWVASGREMWLGIPGDLWSDAIANAMHYKRSRPWVLDLLVNFRDSPEATRHRVRLELGWYDETASNVFSLVVFLSDGLLRLAPQSCAVKPREKALSFFAIASKLPQELQMVLCYRVAGSARTTIPGEAREKGFRDLVRWLRATRK
jgi:hypothetical protein